ncbi:hypothetical protein FB567DRAFT_594752 [Paraphoma chrysanthemicola]|uniref:Uncharacterized protein n=1 Tax=Paraphoma chrysanthemicola TaxID=798071 RepID=A0A8K0R1I7_9PLEO|nr:hypothetical protein FB567DRAFT_594752 [Paraphoma chrysanthemicola]
MAIEDEDIQDQGIWAAVARSCYTKALTIIRPNWVSMLADKVKRAAETVIKIRKKESHEMVEDFLESGERLRIRFVKLLKVDSCHDFFD